MAEKYHGRRRAPGRYNPLSELLQIASQASSPAIKGSAVLAASGGLVAAFAIPANAVDDGAKDTASAEGSVSTIALGERLSENVASRAAARPALTAPTAAAPQAAQTFGALTFTAVEKPPPPPPPPPPPAQTRTERASNNQSRSGNRSSRSASNQDARQSKPKQDAPVRVASGGVLSVAASLTGIPYRYGGSTPAGFDCSGYTQYVFKQVGISLGRTTHAQYAQTRPVSNPQPGDLVFFGGSSPHHVGIYAGNGMMYDSPRTGKSTVLRKIYTSSSHSFRRV
ncbi:MAG TPA: C40 family peptidase [Intrasporangiaceae bacterium]|nr:C40 family peptidase [Intrasporangiaceae bacterium]